MTFTVAFWFTFISLLASTVGNIYFVDNVFNLVIVIFSMMVIGFLTTVWYWNGWRAKF